MTKEVKSQIETRIFNGPGDNVIGNAWKRGFLAALQAMGDINSTEYAEALDRLNLQYNK
jgi:hypothetical protein